MEKKIIGDLAELMPILAANNIAFYTFEHNAFYDNCSTNYDDFKNEIKGRSVLSYGCNGLDYMVIFADTKTANAMRFTANELKKKNKDALQDILSELGIDFDAEYSKTDLIDELKNLSNLEYYKKLSEECSYHQLDYTFIVTGYSQGQAFKVMLVGEVESYITAKYLENIFYNSPVYVNVTVNLNGEQLEEISAYDCAGFDEYELYDEAAIIELYNKHTADKEYNALLRDYLESNLPKDLPYI